MKLPFGRFLLAAVVFGPAVWGPAAFAEAEIRRFDLEIRDRRVQLDEDALKVSKGDRVVMRWTADEAVSLHLHGYDVEFSVVPGQPVEREFEAHATGRFPITSHGFGNEHGGHRTLIYLEVHPE